jgi:hypothetical protein
MAPEDAGVRSSSIDIARWKPRSFPTKELLAHARKASGGAGALASFLLFCVVIMSAVHHARAETKDAAAAAPAPRSARVVADDPSSLVVPDTEHVVKPPRVPPGRYDYIAVKDVFDEIASDLASCATTRGSPRGPGSVRVIIHPSGRVIRLMIGPPYFGTSTGRCISARFRAAPLPSFVGHAQALNYIFYTIPF